MTYRVPADGGNVTPDKVDTHGHVLEHGARLVPYSPPALRVAAWGAPELGLAPQGWTDAEL